MRRRIAKIAAPLAALAALATGARFLVGESRADLESSVFESSADGVRIVVPRGWRATDQPSYPGLLLWMMRSQPPGQIVLTSEAFTRGLYCSWPVECRTLQDSMTARYACALRTRLAAQRLRVGPAQPGPKENQAAGLPSVWFEYDDGKRFLRQAVAMTEHRAVSLVLSAPSNEARAAHVRPFDLALRTLQRVGDAAPPAPGPVRPTPTPAPTEAQGSGASAAGSATSPGAAPPPADAGPSDAAPIDAAAPPPPDGAAIDAGARFESAPAPKIDPVGPCPQ
ncbi:MAG: hypothetical protein ACTHU0_02950 [Kofleriaceae bacterium]